MTVDEIRVLAEVIAENINSSASISYLIGVVAVFTASLIGAYIGTYFKKKAENKANDDHFNKLSEQLRKTTRDTEEIKLALANNNWVDQQHWSIREKYYNQLITHLSNWRAALSDRNSYYMTPGSEHDSSIEDSEGYRKLVERCSESRKEVKGLIGPTLIFLSEETIEALNKLFGDIWMIEETVVSESDIAMDKFKLIDSTRNIILDEARRELRKPVNGIDLNLITR
ncbi:hypothetical protein [Yersinia enterocolitica]|uniref:hypothetical protein n=1 Tax=Yersinia enterocolitica TaxID=630 RepID=UPI0009F1ADD0|nr:hypothetical protein [Yersinia enterocolitica]PNM18874.1 hypothetical protein A6J65_008305 [Yersinia enterocolitica]HDL7734748.1 hypothetical protein [Yersinia enterocolitica]HDL8479365.1 hypothetical protein [Yersinia enterocolitica]HDL8508783.1 hypothetical protein [Yersinia enterocolitica]HEK6321238.1 hypothetical protein [Yersinia enterocolitica]